MLRRDVLRFGVVAARHVDVPMSVKQMSRPPP
jgi:hypothetical protein